MWRAEAAAEAVAAGMRSAKMEWLADPVAQVATLQPAPLVLLIQPMVVAEEVVAAVFLPAVAAGLAMDVTAAVLVVVAARHSGR